MPDWYPCLVLAVGVVVVITVRGELDWSRVFSGLIPDLSKLYKPAVRFNWLLDAVPAEYRQFWSDVIVGHQRDVMISAAATASYSRTTIS